MSKTHWLDAACIGKIDNLVLETHQPLLIKSTGHGSRQMCITDKYGFPIKHKPRQKIHFGFQTGDIVKAVKLKGKYAGRYISRVMIRTDGNFAITSPQHEKQFDVNYKSCKIVHKRDGYRYNWGDFIELERESKCQPVKHKCTNFQPTQLSLFNASKTTTKSQKTKRKSKNKGDDDYEQLSLF